MISRQYSKTTYADGTVEEFNPLFCWFIGNGVVELGTRNYWAIGLYWKWAVGKWSRIRTKFIRIGPFTLYVHYGYTEPYNPHTGCKW